jgi:hypothetical protein
MAPDDDSHPEDELGDWDPRDESRGRDREDAPASRVASGSAAATSPPASRVSSSESESGV